MSRFKPIEIFPMTPEESYETEHYSAWLDGDFTDDHCSHCIAWHAEQILESQALARDLENAKTHDYSTSDHCAACGAEQYESEAYYRVCDRSFL